MHTTKAARQEKCANIGLMFFSWKLTHARDTTWHDTKHARQKNARHFRIGPGPASSMVSLGLFQATRIGKITSGNNTMFIWSGMMCQTTLS